MILGPFAKTPDRANAVDFSDQVADGYYSVVVPLKHDSKMWFIIDPLDYEVWLGIIISVPIYLLAMALADYIDSGYADLNDLTGFILRNALSEQNNRLPKHTKIYQKLLIITWIWSMIILVHSYAGNLTAMLAKPKLEDPIRTLEELLSQNEVPWVIEEGHPINFFLKSSASGTVFRRLFDGATIMPKMTALERMMNGCFTSEIKQEGRYGAICARGSILGLMTVDYTKTGKCNYYYITKDTFLASGSSMAFQVKHTCVAEYLQANYYFAERKPFVGRFQLFDWHSVPNGFLLAK